MKIKKYIQFIKESSGYEYGCVMVEVPVKNWKEITSYIDPEDIYTGGDDTHGIQENPHVTILYGTHKEVTPEMIKSVFDNFTDNINIVVDGIDIFENEDYDVVKFNVKPDGALKYLHDELSNFPNSNSFPDYKPHITICYVKKGTGKKYVKPEYKYEVKNVNKITYSMPNGKKVYFDYNINESVEYEGNSYDSEWKLPTSQERLELERYLNDIFLEIKDLGYTTYIGGFLEKSLWTNKKKGSPYIWICKREGTKKIPINWDEISDTLYSIKSYLGSEGFWFDFEIINEDKQLYIHFDKI
jgi:2'-5' RNA ligase